MDRRIYYRNGRLSYWRACCAGVEPAGGSSDYEAPEMTLLQLAAEALGGCRVGHRPRLNTVICAFVAELGANRYRGKVAQQVLVRPLDAIPFFARHPFTAHRAKLKPQPAGFTWLRARFCSLRLCGLRRDRIRICRRASGRRLRR